MKLVFTTAVHGRRVKQSRPEYANGSSKVSELKNRDVDSDSDSHPDSVDSNDFGGLGLGLAFEKNVGLGLGLAFFQSSDSNIF